MTGADVIDINIVCLIFVTLEITLFILLCTFMLINITLEDPFVSNFCICFF